MMRSVLNLDLGAGPEEQSMGGLVLMRRPAQHHPKRSDRARLAAGGAR